MTPEKAGNAAKNVAARKIMLKVIATQGSYSRTVYTVKLLTIGQSFFTARYIGTDDGFLQEPYRFPISGNRHESHGGWSSFEELDDASKKVVQSIHQEFYG